MYDKRRGITQVDYDDIINTSFNQSKLQAGYDNMTVQSFDHTIDRYLFIYLPAHFTHYFYPFIIFVTATVLSIMSFFFAKVTINITLETFLSGWCCCHHQRPISYSLISGFLSFLCLNSLTTFKKVLLGIPKPQLSYHNSW